LKIRRTRGQTNEHTFLHFRFVFLVTDTWAACSAFFDFCEDDFLGAFLVDFLAAFFALRLFAGGREQMATFLTTISANCRNADFFGRGILSWRENPPGLRNRD
jgi:hypothetical protein